MAGVQVTMRSRSSRSRSKWREYGILLQLKDGGKVTLWQPREENFQLVNRRASSLAHQMKAPLWSAGPDKVVRVTRTEDKCSRAKFAVEHLPPLGERSVRSLPAWQQVALALLVLLVASPFWVGGLYLLLLEQ